jgi:hypothetical protein
LFVIRIEYWTHGLTRRSIVCSTIYVRIACIISKFLCWLWQSICECVWFECDHVFVKWKEESCEWNNRALNVFYEDFPLFCGWKTRSIGTCHEVRIIHCWVCALSTSVDSERLFAVYATIIVLCDSFFGCKAFIWKKSKLRTFIETPD